MGRNHALWSILVATLFLLVLSLWLDKFGFATVTAQRDNAGQPAQIVVSTATEQKLSFSLYTPSLFINSAGLAEITGLDARIQEVGAPDLPIYATYVALPPGADVFISVTETKVVETAVPTLLPVASFNLSLPSNNQDFVDPHIALAANEQLSQPSYQPNQQIYAQNDLYPPTSYTLSEPFYYRDLRLVRLTLHPARYSPAAGLLTHAKEIVIEISFVGENVSQGAEGNGRDPLNLASLVLNFDQARNWRHFPENVLEATATTLPIGQQTFKITLAEDGIYEISGADLQAAGMNIADVNPSTLEMNYRGEPIAFQLIDNGDEIFDPDDKIRFYGWAFDGPRAEKQYLGNHNVYWLWANGSPTHVITTANEIGQDYPLITTFLESITVDTPELYHYHTQTNLWPLFPNEPDAWYMDRLVKSNANPLVRSYDMILPHPAESGPDATVLAEVTTFRNLIDYVGQVSINQYSGYGEKILPRYWNDNITTTVPITALQHLANQVHYTSMTTAGTGAATETIYLNRVTVAYARQLIALENQLLFNAPNSGAHEFHVREFTSERALVWDISDRLAPAAIEMSNAISTTQMAYTFQIGRTHGDNASFIATTLENLRQPISITAYIPPDLEPEGGAEWVAISYADFIPAAQQLAAHRASPAYTNLTTHVVDIADVINQYGYGLAIPEAVRSYLTHAYGSWGNQPAYVTLFGDATFNPLNLPCLAGCQAGFDPNEPIYLLTDLVFKDPYQGLIPTDHTFVTIAGSDLVPDMAIGRIAASTLAEAETVVNKIIQYEQAQIVTEIPHPHNDILFVADNADDGGNFHAENELVAGLIPYSYSVEQLWIENPVTITNTTDVRIAMQSAIQDGLSLLNYRGHGSPWRWAANPELLSADMSLPYMAGFWLNYNKPIVILSADCLDGYFTYGGKPGLGEVFIKLDDDPSLGSRGTAAHWSSTGLGTTFEHTALMRAFYKGLFNYGHTAIGDAINYAKLHYYLGGYQVAEIYSFTLQGDPAMQLFRPDLRLSLNASPALATRGQSVQFTLAIANQALYPDHPIISGVLPDNLELLDVTSSFNITYTHNAETGLLMVDVLSSIAQNETANVTVFAVVADDATAGLRTFQATAHSSGLDLNLADNSSQTTVSIFIEIVNAYLPIIMQK